MNLSYCASCLGMDLYPIVELQEKGRYCSSKGECPENIIVDNIMNGLDSPCIREAEKERRCGLRKILSDAVV